MKMSLCFAFVLIASSITVSPAQASPCLDLSGAYLGTDGDQELELSFNQTACESARIETRYLENGFTISRTVVFDDAFHVTYETPTSRHLEKYLISKRGADFIEEYHSLPSKKVFRTVGSLRLSSAGDLVQTRESFGADGQPNGKFTSVLKPR